MRTRGCSSWRRCSPTSTAVTRCRRPARGCRASSGRCGSVGSGPRRSRSSPGPSSVPGCRSALVGAAAGRRRPRRPPPAAAGLGPGGRPAGPGLERPAGGGRDPAPLAGGGRAGWMRRWSTTWTGRCPGAGSRPGWPARSWPPTRRWPRPARTRRRRAVREADPVLRAGHRRVLRPLHGRGDRPARGDRGVPGRRAGRVRGPRPRGPAPGQGGRAAGQPGPGRRAARRVRRPARGLRRRPAPRPRRPTPSPIRSRTHGHEPVARAGRVGPDGRVRAPGRVHPTPAARLADTATADQRRPTRATRRRPGPRVPVRLGAAAAVPDALPALLRGRPRHRAAEVSSAGKARGRSPTRSCTSTCARCTTT